LKHHYLVSKPIVWNKMELYIVFLINFRLLKLVFHVFDVVLTKGDSFQCEDVSLPFVDSHCIVKHFNHLKFVERLSLTTNDEL